MQEAFCGPVGRLIIAVTHLAAWRLLALGPWGAQLLLYSISPPSGLILWAFGAPGFVLEPISPPSGFMHWTHWASNVFGNHVATWRLESLGPWGARFLL